MAHTTRRTVGTACLTSLTTADPRSTHCRANTNIVQLSIIIRLAAKSTACCPQASVLDNASCQRMKRHATTWHIYITVMCKTQLLSPSHHPRPEQRPANLTWRILVPASASSTASQHYRTPAPALHVYWGILWVPVSSPIILSTILNLCATPSTPKSPFRR